MTCPPLRDCLGEAGGISAGPGAARQGAFTKAAQLGVLVWTATWKPAPVWSEPRIYRWRCLSGSPAPGVKPCGAQGWQQTCPLCSRHGQAARSEHVYTGLGHTLGTAGARQACEGTRPCPAGQLSDCKALSGGRHRAGLACAAAVTLLQWHPHPREEQQEAHAKTCWPIPPVQPQLPSPADPHGGPLGSQESKPVGTVMEKGTQGRHQLNHIKL